MRAGRVLGIVLIAAGLLANKWLLERYIVSDGHVGPVVAIGIVVVQLLAIGAGVVLFRRNDAARLSSLALAAASLLVALTLAELVLRHTRAYRPLVYWYPGERAGRPSERFLSDSVIGWRLRPSESIAWSIAGRTTSIHSTSQGFRVPGPQPGCTRPRVVLLGDSFMFGYGLNDDETIGARLAESLGDRADVVNLAMPGFGTAQMLQVLRTRATAACPSLLVVAFCDDDFVRSLTAFSEYESIGKPMFLLEADTLRLATPIDRPSFADRLTQHLALRRLVDLQRRARAYYRGDNHWFRLNAAILDAMAREAAAARVPILFARLPSQDTWLEFPALAHHMAAHHESYLDLDDPRLARHDLFLTDGHLNPAGALWAAGGLANWVRHNGPAPLH